MTQLSDSQDAFADTDRVSITTLHPDVDHQQTAHIDAAVALVWPYSSSHQSLSLLLVERDIRLRKVKGQVKVTFNGQIAREIARTQVGIGDAVKLGLRNVSWTQTSNEISTPGRKLGWDLDVRRSIKIEIRCGREKPILVDLVAKSPSPSKQVRTVITSSAPAVNGAIDIRKARLSTQYPAALATPKRAPKRAPSGSFVDASLDPFADDDDYIVGTGRKRTKFARHSGAWKLSDDDEENQHVPFNRSPSPPMSVVESQEMGTGETPEVVGARILERTQDTTSYVHNDADQAAAPGKLESEIHLQHARNEDQQPSEEEYAKSMPPSPVATSRGDLRETTGPTFHTESPGQIQSIQPTLVLQPIPPPASALVSPLVQHLNTAMGCFPDTTMRMSESQMFGMIDIQHPDPQLERAEGAIATGGRQSDSSGAMYEESAQDHGQAIDNTRMNENQTVPATLHSPLQGREENTVVEINMEDSTETILNHQSQDNNRSLSFSSPHAIQTLDIPDLMDPLSSVDDGLIAVRDSPDLNDAVAHEDLPLLERGFSPLVAEQSGDLLDDIVDLDALQQHIENEVIIDHAIPLDNEVVEDEDMYGPPARLMETSDIVILDDVIQPLRSSPPSSGSSANQLVQTTSSHAKNANADTDHVSSPKDMTVFDGTHELYEDEDTRLRQQEQDGRDLFVSTVEEVEVVGTGSHSPRQQHLITDDATIETEAGAGRDGFVSSPKYPDHDAGTAEQTQRTATEREMGLFVDVLEETIVAASSRTQTEPEYNGEGIVLQSTPQPNQDVGARILVGLLTPSATQADTFTSDSALHANADFITQLPPTPILTQELTQTPKSPIHGSKPAQGPEPDQDEPLLPDMSAVSGKQPAPSRRLTRKSYHSDAISSEYFDARPPDPFERSPITDGPPSTMPEHALTSPVTRRRTVRIASTTRRSESVDSVGQNMKTDSSSRGFITALSYFPRLATLREHYDQHVDVIAACARSPGPTRRAKAGPKDYYTTLHLADQSCADALSVTAQLFRPLKNALPHPKRGDVVLLRNMRVQYTDGKVALLSTDSSSWATFKSAMDGQLDISINGPPVEYGDPETDYGKELLQWWHDLGNNKHPNVIVDRIDTSGKQTSEIVSPTLRRSQRRKNTASEGGLDIDTSAADNLRVDHQFDHNPDADISVQPLDRVNSAVIADSPELPSPTFSAQSAGIRVRSRRKSKRSESMANELPDRDGRAADEDSLVHELRDGLTYIDDV